MSKNNILILNSSAIYGGGEYFVTKLARQLRFMDHNILLGCRKDTPLYKKALNEDIDVREISFPVEGKHGLKKVIQEIRGIIVKKDIQIIHTNTNYDRTAGAFAVRGTQAKHVTSCHSLESLSHNLTHFIRNRYLTHHFICDGQSIRDLVVSKNGIPINKTTIVNNGIEPEEMARDNNMRAKIRREFNIGTNEILVGNTGRMVVFKGQKYLILGFKNLLEKRSNVKLMLVGEGELMKGLEELARRMQISDKVIFTGFRDDLQALYSAFDIYAHTSLKAGGELFPYSVLYAMAQGLPVVATDSGDISKMVSEENTGFLTGEKSPFQISYCLAKLVENKELRAFIGNKNLDKLKQQFTLQIMAEKIAEIYNSAIKG